MRIIIYIVTAALIKLSILGLGMLSIVTAFSSLFLLKVMQKKLSERLINRFRKKFKIALWGHISIYGALIGKLTFIDGISDIPAFLASHLVVHHMASGLIAATLLIMSLRTYNQLKISNLNTN
ncbi:hypothetical protein [Pseudoalteromonas phenolica]|uniref:Uncharacterized protein n=1 Tax=Pseudoalteromonas phenolica TaxID=161398 RepID=A0A0S2JZ51_9GAMM|nr:hypothetical protein [Pseudoalteromonas phenolica]ALO41392.1 hypothetical protein PP2015_874 [Pseudoalteromonas phenolica]MBE0354062.1 hypothetical protein [Pseudoalteromonas phenolica O-BC30]RXE95460.1 hypothetical protein D9981_15310 [Pseudoalteromonas phenolica O-BC30]